jgi:hypothetical protein
VLALYDLVYSAEVFHPFKAMVDGIEPVVFPEFREDLLRYGIKGTLGLGVAYDSGDCVKGFKGIGGESLRPFLAGGKKKKKAQKSQTKKRSYAGFLHMFSSLLYCLYEKTGGLTLPFL